MHKQQINHEKVIDTVLKQKYYICGELGSGASSKVYLAVVKDTNKQVAIKVIPKQYINTDKKLVELVKTQIYILKNCNSDNIIKCYDVFQSPTSIFLVLQYCNGFDMEQYVHNKKFLSEDNAVWYLKQILNGFKGLHEVGAMHRDFKLANLLLHDRVCKIADLGFAKKMTSQDLTETMLGTQITMAPEVLDRKPYGINADIWSLGVVFYQMLTGKYPYSGLTRTDILKKIKDRNDYHFEDQRISKLAKDFIKGCLTVDPAKRITWFQIYNHPLLNKQTIQLAYGISKTSQIFFQNQEFYRNQSFQESQQSLIILRNSARKQIIIQQIQSSQEKTPQYLVARRNSLQNAEITKTLIKIGISYGTYINSLIYPMKFLSLQLASNVPGIDHYIALYLIYKKCYNQIKQFAQVIKRGSDIFKIESTYKHLWKQFLKCSIYPDLINIMENYQSRSEKIYLQVEKMMVKRFNLRAQQLKMYDQRLIRDLKQKGVDREQFRASLEQYVVRYAFCLLDQLIQKQKQQNVSLIDLAEGLLYYIDMDGKDKLKPQRFDWSRSLPVNYKKSRIQIIQKFKSILKVIEKNPKLP